MVFVLVFFGTQFKRHSIAKTTRVLLFGQEIYFWRKLVVVTPTNYNF